MGVKSEEREKITEILAELNKQDWLDSHFLCILISSVHQEGGGGGRGWDVFCQYYLVSEVLGMDRFKNDNENIWH